MRALSESMPAVSLAASRSPAQMRRMGSVICHQRQVDLRPRAILEHLIAAHDVGVLAHRHQAKLLDCFQPVCDRRVTPSWAHLAALIPLWRTLTPSKAAEKRLSRGHRPLVSQR